MFRTNFCRKRNIRLHADIVNALSSQKCKRTNNAFHVEGVIRSLLSRLDGLIQDTIEALDEDRWSFQRDTFE